MGIGMHSKVIELARLLDSWPGLVSGPALPLIEDSLVLLDHLGDARSLIDVGAGGGMPGLPLKIARPGLQVTLLEANRRKAAFCTHAAALLGLDVEVIAGRAEDVGHGPLRETFDVAVCRALATMPALVELCLPFVRVGGRLLAMKGQVEEAREAITVMGGGEPKMLAASSQARHRGVIVVVPKIASTPARYPRRPGLPAKHPLGHDKPGS